MDATKISINNVQEENKQEATTDYRNKAHHVLDRFKSENLIKYLYGLMVKLYVRWEGGKWDE